MGTGSSSSALRRRATRELLELAREQGISISELARRLGVTRQQVQHLVRDGVVKLDQLERLAQAAGVTIVIAYETNPVTCLVIRGES